MSSTYHDIYMVRDWSYIAQLIRCPHCDVKQQRIARAPHALILAPNGRIRHNQQEHMKLCNDVAPVAFLGSILPRWSLHRRYLESRRSILFEISTRRLSWERCTYKVWTLNVGRTKVLTRHCWYLANTCLICMMPYDTTVRNTAPQPRLNIMLLHNYGTMKMFYNFKTRHIIYIQDKLSASLSGYFCVHSALLSP